MTTNSTAPRRTTTISDPRRRAAIARAGRRYARLAAESVGAPFAAVQVERAGPPTVHEAEAVEGIPGYEGVERVCSAISNHLWYGRTTLAIPDVARASAIFNHKGPPRGIGACLAAPLMSAGGRFLGTLCIADRAPREWTGEETERLQSLAASLSEELDRGEGEPAPAPALDLMERVGDFVASTSELFGGRTPSAQDAADTIEALQTAVEELRIMNEELLATRCLLEVEREHYRELFECVPHPYLITDRDGIIREANEAATELLGVRRAAVAGKPLAVYVPEDARAPFRCQLRALRGGGRKEWRLTLAARGRGTVEVECAAAAARSRDSDAERIYWLLREIPVEEAAAADGAPVQPEANPPAAARGEDFEALLARATLREEVPVLEQLRELIASALDTGLLRVGQRLPSIRAIAERFQITSYAALQAYASLEAEGVVERRERSGVYVAAADWHAPAALPETAEWLAGVLTQACQHQLRIPQLPDLVRRWTGSVAVRCACVESCADTVAALCHDLGNRFGVQAVPVTLAEILTAEGGPRRASALPAAVQEAHVLVTTPYHASRIRAIAETTGKPLLVATMNPEIVEAVEARLADEELTVVCVDRTAGERIRALRGGAYRSRVRVVLADELEAAGLDRSEPVLVTQAARQRLKGAPLRLVAAPTPAFSLDFARKVAETLLRLNLDGGRG